MKFPVKRLEYNNDTGLPMLKIEQQETLLLGTISRDSDVVSPPRALTPVLKVK